MPLKQTMYGGECPLGKFEIIPGDAGCYTSDPLEACPECNFSDLNQKEFDLEKICQCPSDMSLNEYGSLRKQYASTKEEHTKKGFWTFVNENYKKQLELSK